MSASRSTARLLWAAVAILGIVRPAISQEIEISAISPESRAVFDRARDAFHRAWFERASELIAEALALDPELAIANAYKGVIDSFLFFDPTTQMSRALDLSASATPGERLMVSALAAFADGDYEPAAVALRQLIERYPDDRYARHALGFTLVDLGMPHQGLEVLQRLIAEDPDFVAAWNHLGYAYLDLGELGLAEQAMARFVSGDPGNPAARDSWADVMAAQHRGDQAVASLTRALLLEPGSAYCLQHLGDLLVQEGHLAMARRAYQRSFEEKTPYSPRFELLARERIAATWVRQLEHDRAISTLGQVATIAAALGEQASALAAVRAQLTILLSTSRPEAARAVLESYAADVAALGSDSPSLGEPSYLTFFTGWLAVKDGRMADAETLLTELEAAAERADSVELLLGARLLGEISLAQTDYPTAIESFEMAGGDDPLVAVRLALAYEGDGKPAAAAALFDAAATCPSFDIECALASSLAAPLFDIDLALPDFGLPPADPDAPGEEEGPDAGAVRVQYVVMRSEL